MIDTSLMYVTRFVFSRLKCGVFSEPSYVTVTGYSSNRLGRLNDISFRVLKVAKMSTTDLYDPAQRDSHYKGNIAQYLVDLHDANACFKFYGGPEYGNMMFQGGKQ